MQETRQGRRRRTPARPSVRLYVGFCRVLVLLVSFLVPATAQPPALTETQIKAGFLFNFTKFVEWPPDAFANAASPIVLGIVGEDPFGDLLTQAVAGKTVNGRTVSIRHFNEDEDFHACNILFVTASEEKHVTRILERLRGSSVLTVGESESFAQKGGIINFFIEENKVRLQINLEAAARSRVKISSKVIAVAHLVPDNQPGGKS